MWAEKIPKHERIYAIEQVNLNAHYFSYTKANQAISSALESLYIGCKTQQLEVHQLLYFSLRQGKCKKLSIYTKQSIKVIDSPESSVKIGTIQRRLAWSQRMDDTHNSRRSITLFFALFLWDLFFASFAIFSESLGHWLR
jgi:hypothetical protein